MPHRQYKPIEDCRDEIQRYVKQLKAGTDDKDDEKRDSISTKRYRQDLRWLDHWLDDHDIDSAFELTPAEANEIGTDLSMDFNGTTTLYR